MPSKLENPEQFYIEWPGVRRGRPLRDARGLQLAWMIGWAVITVVCIFFQLPVGVGVCLLVGATALPGDWGPLYTYPADYWHGLKVKRQGNELFNPEKPGVSSALYPWIDDFLGLFGSVYHQGTDTDTVYLLVDGWQHLNDDVPDKWRFQMLEAEAIKTAIAQTRMHIGYGFFSGQRPFDPTAMAIDTDKHYIHDDFKPPEDGSEWDEFDAREYHDMELVFTGMVENMKAKYYGLIPLTINRPPSWQKIVDHPEDFTVQELRRSPLYRVFSALLEGLEAAGFKGIRLLTAEELHRYVFDTWCVNQMEQGGVSSYYQLPGYEQWQLPLELPDGSLAHVESPFPVKSIAVLKTGRHYNVLQTDPGNYHAVLVPKRFQRRKGQPGSANKLLMGPYAPWVWYASTHTTSSPRLDKWFLRKQHRLTLALLQERGTLGTVLEEQEERDKADVGRTAIDQLYLSGSKTIRSRHYVIISATSVDELSERVEDAISVLRGEGVKFKRISGRTRLLPCFLQATLGPRL